jgi:hypothetical protein
MNIPRKGAATFVHYGEMESPAYMNHLCHTSIDGCFSAADQRTTASRDLQIRRRADKIIPRLNEIGHAIIRGNFCDT